MKDFHEKVDDKGNKSRVPLVTHTAEVFATAKVGTQRDALLQAVLLLCPNHGKRRQVCNVILACCEKENQVKAKPEATATENK